MIDWPAACKPFYARELDGSEEMVSAVDLLMPYVGEVAGGSLREHRTHILEKRMAVAMKEQAPNLQW